MTTKQRELAQISKGTDYFSLKVGEISRSKALEEPRGGVDQRRVEGWLRTLYSKPMHEILDRHMDLSCKMFGYAQDVSAPGSPQIMAVIDAGEHNDYFRLDQKQGPQIWFSVRNGGNKNHPRLLTNMWPRGKVVDMTTEQLAAVLKEQRAGECPDWYNDSRTLQLCYSDTGEGIPTMWIAEMAKRTVETPGAAESMYTQITDFFTGLTGSLGKQLELIQQLEPKEP